MHYFKKSYVGIAFLGLIGTTLPVFAGDDPVFSSGRTFSQRNGKNIYMALCAGCHMAQGQGAAGAGNYPALAANPKLASTGYIATVILHGYKAMPILGEQLDNEQVANVINYVRENFGKFDKKQAGGKITPEEVQALRPTHPVHFKHF